MRDEIFCIDETVWIISRNDNVTVQQKVVSHTTQSSRNWSENLQSQGLWIEEFLLTWVKRELFLFSNEKLMF